VVYTGCVGDDDLAEQLKAANARDGLDEVYYVKRGEKTGVCAVVITGHYRYVIRVEWSNAQGGLTEC